MSKISPQTLSLADHIGQFIEYWGFKQIHGKIWALVFLNPDPVDANFLIEQLGVSKALISMSLKDLLHYNVILEVEKSGPSTQKYAINPNIVEVITDVLMGREAKMLTQIKGACDLLFKSQKSKKNSEMVDEKRLKQLRQMVQTADGLLHTMLSFRKLDLKILEKNLYIS